MRKLALVTGASRGIGRAGALALARSGYDVIAVARDLERLVKLRDEIVAAAPVNVFVHSIDVSDPEAVARLQREVAALGRSPDVIVNNAGAGRWLFVDETSPEEARRILDVPFFATYLVTHAFLPEMLARRAGFIVNVSTPASFFPWPGATLYASARWAVTGFSRALRADLAGSGIEVALLVPGEVSSDYFASNPGAHERLPWISRFLPVLTPEQVATRLVRVVNRNAGGDHVFPFAFAALNFVGRLFPRLFQWSITRTGYTYARRERENRSAQV